MEELVESLASLKPSLPFNEIDHNMDLMSQFEHLNGGVVENINLGLMGFSNENFLPFLENFVGNSPVECPKPNTNQHPVALVGEPRRWNKKRAIAALSYTNSMNSSGTVKEPKKKKRNKSGSRKRETSSSKDDVEDPKEVVHVRARRGLATDSHSLAERVRRRKINEKMRCLQSLVPGCYKTMGMAGVLDEIINYVHSLQNQVEFLSMKLSSAANSFYDFSLDMEVTKTPQVLTGDGDAYLHAEAIERLMREQGLPGCTSFQSAMPF